MPTPKNKAINLSCLNSFGPEILRYILFLLIFASCSHYRATSIHSSSLYQVNRKPMVAILPMEDCTFAKHSMRTVNALTHSVISRLDQKNQLTISPSQTLGKEFIVTMQLLQHDEATHNSSELTLSVHLKIVDIRAEKPQIVFQEVINHNTLLEDSLPSEEALNWQDPSFRVSPIGLLHAKVSRELALRIEDYIKLATKG